MRIRYGGWRHFLDGAVSLTTVFSHLWCLHFDPVMPALQKSAAWTSIAVSATSFFVGWQRHMSGYIKQGMCCHLMFRQYAFWPLVLTHTVDRFSEREWVLYVVSNTFSYIAAAFVLWLCARRIYCV
jgi:hypothetical protein